MAQNIWIKIKKIQKTIDKMSNNNIYEEFKEDE